MDSSDILRKKQATAIWVNYQTILTQAGENPSTCSSLLTAGSNVKFPTYEFKNKVIVGKAVCCSNTPCL